MSLDATNPNRDGKGVIAVFSVIAILIAVAATFRHILL